MLLPALEAFGAGQRRCASCSSGAGERLAGLFPFRARWRATRACRCPRSPPGCTRIACFARRSCAPTRRAPCLEALFDCLRCLASSSSATCRRASRSTAYSPQVLAARGAQSFVSRSLQPRPAAQAPRHHLRPVPPASRRTSAASPSSRTLSQPSCCSRRTMSARWIDDFLRIEASGWKGRNGSAMACTESEPALRDRDPRRGVPPRAAHRRAGSTSAAGRSRGASASLAGEAAYAFKTAYDESYARFSPGAMLELANCARIDADAARCNGWIRSPRTRTWRSSACGRTGARC